MDGNILQSIFMGVMSTDYHSGEAIIIAPYLE
jgi:hypothetical protein